MEEAVAMAAMLMMIGDRYCFVPRKVRRPARLRLRPKTTAATSTAHEEEEEEEEVVVVKLITALAMAAPIARLHLLLNLIEFLS